MPKIMGDSLEEHRATTRMRVFEALVTLLAHVPFTQITMADLAAEAGIGRSALYNHFKDKEAVVLAFASDETDRYLESLEERLDGVDSPEARLRAYVSHHVETLTEFHVGPSPVVASMLSPESRQAMREHAVAVEQVLRGILADGLAQGAFDVVDLDSAVSLVHATLQARHASPDATIEFVMSAVRG